MASTAEGAFLEAIREQPDDDTPRLMYADWLEERGDERGEFIRVQCELARMDEEDERRPALEMREGLLRAGHERTWLAEVQEAARGALTRWEFRRGFVESVT